MPASTPALDSPRFDWMQATIRRDVVDIAETLAGSLGGDIDEGRGLNGYRASKVIKRRDETLARVLYGGNGNPHLIATGACTDDVVPVLRGAWSGEHEVTRMDSAQDFDQEGGYDRLHGIMLAVAESSRLGVTEIESTRNGVRSRTTYLGAPSSRVRVRLYEKGRFEHQEGRAGAPLHWVRMEAQIRPTGVPARMMAGELDAMQAWGMSKWTCELAELAMGAEVERVTMQLHREPDYMRAIRSLSRQYRATLERAIEVEGSWEAVGRLLGIVEGAAV